MYSTKSSESSALLTLYMGRSLAHYKLDAHQRAAIAAQILAGEADIDLTARMLAQILKVSIAYVHAACELTPAERHAIAGGHDSWTPIIKPATAPKPVNVKKLTALIHAAGVDQVLEIAAGVEAVGKIPSGTVPQKPQVQAAPKPAIKKLEPGSFRTMWENARGIRSADIDARPRAVFEGGGDHG